MEPIKDPLHGIGGAYVIDPATGLRVPQAEWDARQASSAPAEPDAPAADAFTDKPSRRRRGADPDTATDSASKE